MNPLIITAIKSIILSQPQYPSPQTSKSHKMHKFRSHLRPLLQPQLRYHHSQFLDHRYHNMIESKLLELFAQYSNKLLLAKTFRIFPFYFNQDILQSMLESTYMDEYVKYIVNSNNGNNPTTNRPLKHLLKKLNIKTPEQQKILQTYINFIKRSIDLTTNDSLMQTLDIQHPQNWFQSIQSSSIKKFIYHHGPTNSGKTFSAIAQFKKLKQNQKGIYMAPLRLLAWETQKKLGKCNLITGQEKDYQNSNLTSCTIEAAQLSKNFDIAIIDQIQMLGEMERGWAWTSALLGVNSNNIHLCGDERALHLVSKLVSQVGGTLEQRDYSRLSKLHVITKYFNINDIAPGDCIINFGTQTLYYIRQQINQIKGTHEHPLQTAIVYGKLPHKCRKTQAQKFNNGQMPYLVATDAIGMGLNLNIHKIIFINITKITNEKKQRQLTDSEIRQIAGRAGRGYSEGYVQCSNYKILKRVKNALKSVNITYQQNKSQPQQTNNKYQQYPQIPPIQSKEQLIRNPPSNITTNKQSYDPLLKRQLKQIQNQVKRACISFPITLIQRTSIRLQKIFKKKPKVSQIISLMKHLSKQNQQLYFIQNNHFKLKLSDYLQPLNLPLQTHYHFMNCPLSTKDNKSLQLIIKFAKQFKYQGRVRIPHDIITSYENNYQQFGTISSIKELELQYHQLEAYNWLWNQFQSFFPDCALANKIKSAISEKINQMLGDPDIRINDKEQNKKGQNNFNQVE